MRGDRVAAYARVSTHDQDPEPQLERIRAWADGAGLDIVHEFSEVASGKDSARPRFNGVMRLARGNRFDVVAVAKIDRWARSLIDLERTVGELAELGVTFYVVDDALRFDSDDPMGKAYVRFLGILAELESDLISQRTREALDAKRRRGEPIGRPAKPCALCDQAREDGGKRVRIAGDRYRVCRSCAELDPATRRRILEDHQGASS